MNQNRFKAFLKEGQPFGDSVDLPFVDSAVGEQSLPDPNSWEELDAYLEDHDAEEDVIKAAKHIWGLYVAHRRCPVRC